MKCFQSSAFRFWLIVSSLLVFSFSSPARAFDTLQEDDAAIRELISRYCQAVISKDIRQLASFYSNDLQNGLLLAERDWGKPFRSSEQIRAGFAISHIGVKSDRALVRWRFSAEARDERTIRTIKSGVKDSLLRKVGGRWVLTDRSWATHDILLDIENNLRELRRDRDHPAPSVMHLVAGLRGGAWVPLRAMWWDGALLSAKEVGEGEDEASFRAELYEHFDEFFDQRSPGYAHLFFQRGRSGWKWVGAMWHPGTSNDLELEKEQRAEDSLRRMREQLESDFGDAELHFRLGRLLYAQGLFVEASDEYEKAEELSPGTVPSDLLETARQKRSEDPTEIAQSLVYVEERLGLPQDHPLQRIRTLSAKGPRTAWDCAWLGLEASKWGEDRLASDQLTTALNLWNRGLYGTREIDALQIMIEHLERRVEIRRLKPPGAIWSDRFFVRYHPGDRNILPLLVALEHAQHVIYSTFDMPMSGTEVILFQNQPEFRLYREGTQGTRTSEYLQAETITNVMTSRGALHVLSQEIITFPHSGTDTIKTIQHEYGHVAVNRYARGRFVPDWINEGIACLTEGGYPDYRERCKNAYKTGMLIPMRELMAVDNRVQPGQWTFEGDRALLAYSQANALIEFIIRTRGTRALLAVLDGIGNGLNPGVAFKAAMGPVGRYNSEQAMFDLWVRDLATSR